MSTSQTGETQPTLSPLEFWLGLFLVLYSAGYLSIALRLGEFGSGIGRVGTLAWVAIGLALFAAGGLAVMRGLSYAPTRVLIVASAALFAFRAVFGTFSLGNPFAGAVSTVTQVTVGLGIVADLVLALGAVWFLVIAARSGARDDAAFGRGAAVFLAVFALQTAVAPLIEFLIYLFSSPAGLSAFVGSNGLVYTVKVLPTLVRGAAGAIALVAAGQALRRRGLVPLVVAATGAWAVADLVLGASLWVIWLTGPSSSAPALFSQIRTTLFVALPALALLGVTGVLRREVRA